MAGLVRSGSGVGLADAEQHSRAAAAAEGKEKEEGIDSVRAGGGGGGGSAAGASPAAVAVGSVSGIGARQPRPPPPPGPPSGSPSGGEEEGDDGYGLGVATPLSDLYGPSVLAPALALAATAAAATGEPSSSLSSQPPPPPPSPEPLRRRGSSGVLSGLARLLPLGMMPRTSLRYKRHLSCADMDAFQVIEGGVCGVGCGGCVCLYVFVGTIGSSPSRAEAMHYHNISSVRPSIHPSIDKNRASPPRPPR